MLTMSCPRAGRSQQNRGTAAVLHSRVDQKQHDTITYLSLFILLFFGAQDGGGGSKLRTTRERRAVHVARRLESRGAPHDGAHWTGACGGRRLARRGSRSARRPPNSSPARAARSLHEPPEHLDTGDSTLLLSALALTWFLHCLNST